MAGVAMLAYVLANIHVSKNGGPEKRWATASKGATHMHAMMDKSSEGAEDNLRQDTCEVHKDMQFSQAL